MDLIRKILFVIEGKYVDTWLPGSDVQIDGYDMKTIAAFSNTTQIKTSLQPHRQTPTSPILLLEMSN